jgi:hypothetical protein
MPPYKKNYKKLSMPSYKKNHTKKFVCIQRKINFSIEYLLNNTKLLNPHVLQRRRFRRTWLHAWILQDIRPYAENGPDAPKHLSGTIDFWKDGTNEAIVVVLSRGRYWWRHGPQDSRERGPIKHNDVVIRLRDAEHHTFPFEQAVSQIERAKVVWSALP